MEWIKDFYINQYNFMMKLMGEASLKITKHHFNQVKIIKEACEVYGGNILELGAGFGQFAVAAAESGYNVTAIELASNAVQNMKELSNRHLDGDIEIIEGNFYEINLDKQFDVVCYWDGFGIGSDKDQRHLLNRINNWLKPEGVAFIDIYTPWYWTAVSGQKMDFGKIKRKYSFDAKECCMLDTWWLEGEEDKSVTQKLRCYSPVDMDLLLQGIGLKIASIEPGGGIKDYKTLEYEEKVSLDKAMSYRVKLVKEFKE